MIPIRCLILMLLCISLRLAAINDQTTSGARSAGLGTASVALADPWAIQNNQAGLAYIERPVIATYYQNRFLIKELGFQQGIFVYPAGFGTLGINVSYFGYELYNESRLGLAYARKFGERFSAGLQFDYMSFNMADPYGKTAVLTFEMGVIAQLSDKVDAGLHIFNPVHTNLSDYNDENIPAIIRFGLAYQLDKELLTTMEIEKNIDHKPNFKAGLEYRLIEQAWVRAGISSNPSLFAFGFGLKLGNFKIDLASSYHTTLGFSPQVSLLYQLGK